MSASNPGVAHSRQAHPIDRRAALAQQGDDGRDALGDDALPALAHVGVAVLAVPDALGVVGAEREDGDVDRLPVQLGADIVEDVEAAIAGEAGRPLAELAGLGTRDRSAGGL